jgi:mono/diheme cytochrome c family protein
MESDRVVAIGGFLGEDSSVPIKSQFVEDTMAIRHAALFCFSLLVASALAAQEKPTVKKTPIQQTSPVSGKEMYTQYCAACHGADGKGSGPAAVALKTPPADLTTLAKRHDGKYPSDYVATLLRSGTGAAAHGSSDMPTWGPLFKTLDPMHDEKVQQRIRNLNVYLTSLQAK